MQQDIERWKKEANRKEAIEKLEQDMGEVEDAINKIWAEHEQRCRDLGKEHIISISATLLSLRPKQPEGKSVPIPERTSAVSPTPEQAVPVPWTASAKSTATTSGSMKHSSTLYLGATLKQGSEIREKQGTSTKEASVTNEDGFTASDNQLARYGEKILGLNPWMTAAPTEVHEPDAGPGLKGDVFKDVFNIYNASVSDVLPLSLGENTVVKGGDTKRQGIESTESNLVLNTKAATPLVSRFAIQLETKSEEKLEHDPVTHPAGTQYSHSMRWDTESVEPNGARDSEGTDDKGPSITEGARPRAVVDDQDPPFQHH